MGLTSYNHEKRTYLSIVEGKFVKRVEAGTFGSRERTYKDKDDNDKTVHELIFSDITARISNIEIAETEFGDQLRINMDDVGDSFTISMSFNSKYAKAFVQSLPGIALGEDVFLEPYNFIGRDGDKVVGMNVKQDGEKIKWHFTKETPNGLPIQEPGAQLDKDEFKLLMAQQTIFLKKFTKKFIEDNFKNKPVPATPEPQSHDEAPVNEAVIPGESDITSGTPKPSGDLPF